MPSFTTDTTGTLVFPQNRLRKSFTIQNQDASINVFIGRQAIGTLSTTVHDFRLGAGAAISLNSDLDGARMIQDAWNVVAASGTPRVAWFETEDVVR